ncbi:MAG: helix-hairpin-helix domain-containing protein [Candidatus Omnitrophica bacterium]|nr:helix-hairpin-helix domain-containing protein [Candidatus Omnitrophota bacterium]
MIKLFNLDRSERTVITILILSFLAGAALTLYKKAYSPTQMKIVRSEAAIKSTSLPIEKAKVNINVADESDLMALKGVGRTVARRIVEYREKNGLFLSADDLKKVRGIGPALFEKIKDNISVE